MSWTPRRFLARLPFRLCTTADITKWLEEDEWRIGLCMPESTGPS
jgi:hypothetical protein